MAISSPGVGSGLDINSIVTQLTAIEKQPLLKLQAKASQLQTQLSTFATVKSQLASLQDASQALLASEVWGAKSFTTSNSSAVTGSAGTSALAGSFTVKVANLASAQSLRTDAVPALSTISSLGGSNGTLSITKGGVTTSVAVGASDTLTTVAGAINLLSSTSGVSAVVVTSDAGQRLLLSSTSTGTDHAFTVTDGTGTGKFGYDASGAGGLSLSQAAKNATTYINPTQATETGTSGVISWTDYGGIKITSSTNTVSDALPGLTLNLLSATSSDAQITVGNDTETIKAKIQAFQEAYNTLVGNLRELTKYDATTKKAGALQGDGTAVGLLALLRSMISAEGPTASSAVFPRLSNVGLQVQQGGLLSTNSSTLTTALNSLDSLKTFFHNNGGSTATDGLARRFRDFASNANGIEGTMSLKKTALQAAITRNASDQDKMNLKIAAYQKRLSAQYSSLDTKMGALNGLSGFVTTQVAQWNKSK
jgi:flagellar hook-associated protein 2